MNILTFDMIRGNGNIVAAKRDDFTSRQLSYNLDWLWCWNGVIDSDGPCVAISFN